MNILDIEKLKQLISRTDISGNDKVKWLTDFIDGREFHQQERSYSEEEVFRLTLEALDLGMRIRQDQLNGYSEKSGKELHEEWFEQFKK
jgi:hypothetical protein